MNLLMVLISSLLYTAAFPLWNVGHAAFIALVPLFMAAENARSTLRAAVYGALWGALVSTGMGYWLFPTLIGHFNVWPPKAVLFFIVSVTLPTAMIYAGLIAVYRFTRSPHVAWYALVVPAIWTLGEYLKEMVPVLLPWGAIGYAALPFERFVQVADIAGIHGLTFIIVMINALVWFMLGLIVRKKPAGHALFGHRPMSGPSRPKALMAAAGMLILALSLPAAYGAFRLERVNEDIRNRLRQTVPMEAVLVQGNFDLDDRWSGMGFYNRIGTYLEMSVHHQAGRDIGEPETREQPESRKRVIVWPETTLNEPARLDSSLFGHIMNVIGEDALLISGGIHRDDATGKETNCAYLVSGKGGLLRYDKHILLPYAETTLMVDWLGQYYTAPAEFAPGRTASRMDTPHGRVGMSICFEILYPRYIARSTAAGADFLVNMSNDAWFGDSPMPYMHLKAARMRAIENRRFLLRTANSGVSALIAPDGRILGQTDLFQRQVIKGDFVHMSAMSLYTRYGDWLIALCGIILGIRLLAIVMAGQDRT